MANNVPTPDFGRAVRNAIRISQLPTLLRDNNSQNLLNEASRWVATYREDPTTAEAMAAVNFLDRLAADVERRIRDDNAHRAELAEAEATNILKVVASGMISKICL